MVLPTLFVGVQAIRTNALERGTLETLGQRLGRSRTYADVEDAMFNQTQVIWRYLGGDPTAKQEFPLTVQVVDFRFDRWTADLPPDEVKLADAVRRIEADIQAVAARVFQLHDAGRRDQAALVARRELLERLQPTLASVNREIYRQARELSVQGAVAQMRSIVEAKRRVLWATVFVALVAGLVASWLISRDLTRPLTELRHAMAVVGAGDLEHAIVPRSSDEIGELARAFVRMTEQLRQSRAQLVQSEKLASIGQMAAAVAHGLRNPLASLRAAAQLARHRVDAPAAREQLDAIAEQLRQRRIELAVHAPAALPDVQVDPMRLEQALTELVSNALDAMPEGGRLDVATRVEPGAGGAGGVVVAVTDSGPGIAPEILPNLCEPFFTTRPEGTGLGLAIAKRYVEEAGGRLDITSTVGRATTVPIWLPSASGEVAPQPARSIA